MFIMVLVKTLWKVRYNCSTISTNIYLFICLFIHLVFEYEALCLSALEHLEVLLLLLLLMFSFPWSLFLPGFLVLMPWGSSDQEVFRSRRVSLLRVLWLLCLLRFWVSTLLLGSLDTASKKKKKAVNFRSNCEKEYGVRSWVALYSCSKYLKGSWWA